MDPTVFEAFKQMSLFFKGVSVVTGHLSKMMTSSYSFSHSTCLRLCRKPTTCSEGWKLCHSSDSPKLDNKNPNNTSLLLHANANSKAGSYSTNIDCELNSIRPSTTQHVSRNQVIRLMKHKNCYKSNSEDNITTNTVSENKSGNTTINISSNTDYRIPFKPPVSTHDHRQSHFLYDAGTLKSASAPKTIDNFTTTKDIITKEEYSSNFDSKSANTNTIKKDRYPSTNMNRNLSTNNSDASINEVYE
ncbi:hypothetical protein O181_007158 [Austropuccinia psidii MF-1]|uniref:Uncharacterized protein n=1 Tax=Austropuccinia psidii MF-1 TaxID=1389203 RepID=A0A9Q3BLV1_9BASI|nr:hypothetical protein [Austropuccinia psidii MF-1]